MGALLLSWVLAAVLGFAAHRGSVCTVRAVAEVLSTGRGYYLLSFAKSALWVLVAIGPAIWLGASTGSRLLGMQFSMSAVLGGFLFGIGAALNAGCAFSTLARLADGQVRMLVTLSGMGASAFTTVPALGIGAPSPPTLSATPLVLLRPYETVLSGLLLLWAFSELVRLYRSRPGDISRHGLLFVSQYRLSTAAALMGVANGMLFMLVGSWDYTGALRLVFEGGGHATTGANLVLRLFLLLGVLSGMLLSTWQRSGFRLDYRPSSGWTMNLAGGFLMGAGAAVVPGGNDTLILFSLPTLSAHALPAYLALLSGTASVLVAVRALTGSMMSIRCENDLCRISAEHSNRL